MSWSQCASTKHVIYSKILVLNVLICQLFGLYHPVLLLSLSVHSVLRCHNKYLSTTEWLLVKRICIFPQTWPITYFCNDFQILYQTDFKLPFQSNWIFVLKLDECLSFPAELCEGPSKYLYYLNKSTRVRCLFISLPHWIIAYGLNSTSNIRNKFFFKYHNILYTKNKKCGQNYDCITYDYMNCSIYVLFIHVLLANKYLVNLMDS